MRSDTTTIRAVLFRCARRILPHIPQVLRLWRWGLRIVILWIILGQLSPVGQRLYPDSRQVVDTLQPQVCVHTNLTNEVDVWKMRQSLQLIREMGATTIVEFFPWAYFEPANDHYNWHQADLVVRHAENQGLHIIARMGFVPAWARPDNTTFNYLPDESFADFADFVAVFAARYAGTINHIILWNEPNLAFEWGYQEIDPARYVRLLQAVYQPVHAANPNVIILAGALAPTLEPSGSLNGLNDLLYLEGLYTAGFANYFDALAVHTYGLQEPPEAAPGFDRLNFRRVELIRAIMVNYHDADKPIYITESGWNDNPRWVYGVRPSQRVLYTIDAFEWAEANWDWVTNVCIWIFRQPRMYYTYRDNFTLVTPDFQPKPLYYAIQAYARGWEIGGALWLPPPGQ